jgi:hypothetical protein
MGRGSLRLRGALPGQPLHLGAPRVGEPQELRHLVEGLARGIVPGLAQEAVPPPASTCRRRVCPPETRRATKGGSARGSSREGAKRWASMWWTPTRGQPSPKAAAFAQLTPTRRAR